MPQRQDGLRQINIAEIQTDSCRLAGQFADVSGCAASRLTCEI
jgi:hypothetical protein